MSFQFKGSSGRRVTGLETLTLLKEEMPYGVDRIHVASKYDYFWHCVEGDPWQTHSVILMGGQCCHGPLSWAGPLLSLME